VAEHSPKTEANQKYILKKCPDYEFHQLEPKGKGQSGITL